MPSADLILFGINAIIRLGKAGREAAEQHQRDNDILVPDLIDVAFDMRAFLNGFFADPSRAHLVEQVPGRPAPPYSEYWDRGRVNAAMPGAEDALFLAAVQIKLSENPNVDLRETLPPFAEQTAGVVLVRQWSKNSGPVSPLAKFMLTVADVALEYVSSNPSVLGLKGSGEKMVGAFAGNLSALIPDDGQYGSKAKLTERILGIVVHAGLKTIQENPSWIVSKEHVQDLIKNTLEPVVETMPADINAALDYQKAVDAILGPASAAAFKTLADHQVAFLGKSFDPQGKAIGALTKALLSQAAQGGIAQTFSEEGLLALYSSALQVAVDRPELFVKGDGTADEIARDILSGMAAALANAEAPFDGDFAAQLGAVVLEAVGNNTALLFDENKPWEKVAGELVQSFTKGLKEAVAENGAEAFEKRFSKSQLLELGRVFLNQVVQTPSLIAGREEQLQIVVKAVAAAMAADEKLLLTSNDWLKIVSVAMAEAATNPARLFGMESNSAGSSLAADVMSVLLKSASKAVLTTTGKERSVLFGATLRESVSVLLKAASGIPDLAKANIGKVGNLADSLNALVESNSGRLGSKEWLRLFRIMLPTALMGEELEELDLTKAEKLLAGGLA